MSLLPKAYSKKRPEFTATSWLAVNRISMFLIFLIFPFFTLVYPFSSAYLHLKA